MKDEVPAEQKRDAWWPAAFLALGITLTVAWGGILVWGVAQAAMWLASGVFEG
jgi:hypothetical protein